jgi:hypothetical protein
LRGLVERMKRRVVRIRIPKARDWSGTLKGLVEEH